MTGADEACTRQKNLIAALMRPAAFPHPVQALQLLETHISWVILTGEFAYKVKKPLDLQFLDYSSLERRRHFCAEELRLNRRTAPRLYLAVVPITGTPAAPSLGGDGPVLEYAVQMRQFPQEDLLSARLAAGQLAPDEVDSLARVVATFHVQAAVVPDAEPWGTPEEAHRPVQENFSQIRPRLADGEEQARLVRIAAWAQARQAALRPVFARRREEGRVRECHGDLHLGNLVLLDGVPCPFDGIEFSAALRWIDVMSDTAFLMMDLEQRGRPDLAWRFLDGYLQHTGDFDGLAVLDYYRSYRAMVRAKVTAIRLEQAGADDTLLPEYRRYAQLAERYTRPVSPCLLITCGPSGSGKTFLTQPLLERRGMVRLRSDVERKRLFGLAADADSASALGGGIYSPAAGERTYARLLELAETILTAGFPVLVDATFLTGAQRTPFRALAGRLGVPFAILRFTADEATLYRRVTERRAGQRDASEADGAVLARQLAQQEPPAAEEQAHSLTIDSTQPPAPAALDQALQTLLGKGNGR